MKLVHKKVLLIALLCLGTFSLGRLTSSSEDDNDSYRDEVRQFNEGDFSYINPLLECDLGQKYIAQDKPRPYESDIQNYIDSEKRKGNVQEVSMYYRDLNNGPWVGIDEQEIFFPASLLKVPIVMYMYKESEKTPGLLDTKIKIPQIVYENAVQQHFAPEKSIVQGNEYTYKELIQYALRYSDNNAALVLQNVSGNKHIETIFKDLHLDVDLNASQGKGVMSVKDYAMFFRILYNSSYLSQHNSEEMLRTLGESTFDNGIRKYIPEKIVVANKFGEINLDNQGYTQLHDCGIVYYPSHPYIMCVMTRGYDEDKLANVIANISRLVYKDIEAQAKR